MSSAAPPPVLPQTCPVPRGRHGLPILPANASHRSRSVRPESLSALSAGLAKEPAAEADAHPSYPQVPPESPLPMHARAFDFVGVRDLFGLLTPGRRRRSPPALTAVPPSAAPRG